MSIRMRHTKGHTGNRRSHHGLKKPTLSKCKECGADYIRHKACQECGMYRGRQVFDAAALKERKEARKEAKIRTIGEVTGKEQTKTDKPDSDQSTPDEGKPLSAEELSKK